ncbi:DNA polymerase III PolC-type [bacterium HR29]|jgi:DNA polymerase-3 subunit epsilon|nr:DNA polymerase III PolC-type [bacterium HR29]
MPFWGFRRERNIVRGSPEALPVIRAKLPAPVVVVDLETTGFFPRRDRVVEVALVTLDPTGKVEERFDTLVNPRRDPGPVRRHGIRPRDLVDAPEFGDIAGHVAARLEGRLLVAHNARFDAGFLVSEFLRIGAPLPPLRGICTLELARRELDAPNYRLATLCELCGLPPRSWHVAADDAEATARLFLHLLQRGPHPTVLEAATIRQPSPGSDWPRIPVRGRPKSRISSPGLERTPLAGMFDRVPTPRHESPGAHAYLELLSRALEDRSLTPDEERALAEVALSWGLTSETLAELHREFLRSAVAYAWEDGRISDEEREYLWDVSRLLGVPDEELEALVQDARRMPPAPPAAGLQLTPGMSVCFTGESMCRYKGEYLSREMAERLARRAGLVVRDSVTKKLDVLVCADLYSQSTKARMARRYGIPMIEEGEFWALLGVDGIEIG